MTQTTHKQAVVVAPRFRTGRPIWLAAAVAAMAVTAVLLLVPLSGSDDTALESAAPASQTLSPSDGVRYDGGPEEGSRDVTPVDQPSTRYDGGPEEGSRGELFSGARSNAVPGIRYDGGPEEGSRGSAHE